MSPRAPCAQRLRGSVGNPTVSRSLTNPAHHPRTSSEAHLFEGAPTACNIRESLFALRVPLPCGQKKGSPGHEGSSGGFGVRPFTSRPAGRKRARGGHEGSSGDFGVLPAVRPADWAVHSATVKPPSNAVLVERMPAAQAPGAPEAGAAERLEADGAVVVARRHRLQHHPRFRSQGLRAATGSARRAALPHLVQTAEKTAKEKSHDPPEG